MKHILTPLEHAHDEPCGCGHVHSHEEHNHEHKDSCGCGHDHSHEEHQHEHGVTISVSPAL